MNARVTNKVLGDLFFALGLSRMWYGVRRAGRGGADAINGGALPHERRC